jgi:hypothetical protein
MDIALREAAMEYAAFLDAQAAALVEQYFGPFNAAAIAIAGFDSLSHRQMVHGGSVAAMPGYAATDAMIWRDKKDRTELWVRTFDKTAKPSNLYERAWRDYVRIFGKTEMQTELNGHAMVIDHLYPETAAFRANLTFVRLLAIERRPNSLNVKTVSGPFPTPHSNRSSISTPIAKPGLLG